MKPQPVFNDHGKFYPSFHQSGVLLPSVSTVLETIKPSGYGKWRRSEVEAGRDPARHAARGTFLHTIAENILSDPSELREANRPPTPDQLTQIQEDDLSSWVANLTAGLAEVTGRFGAAIATESYVETDWYAGTFDALIGGEDYGAVLDIKTTLNIAPWLTKGDRPWTERNATQQKAFKQILGYCNAAMGEDPFDYANNGTRLIDTGIILVVSPEAFSVLVSDFTMEDFDRWVNFPGSGEDNFHRQYTEVIAAREAAVATDRAERLKMRQALGCFGS